MDDLKNKVDSFIIDDIRNSNKYEIIDDIHLNFTYNRFDIAIKYLYLKLFNIGEYNKLDDLYLQHIKAFSFGDYTEKGNDSKNSKSKFISDFNEIFTSIKENGFNKQTSLVPVSCDGSILNGAHRVSSSIYLNKPVTILKTDLSPVNYDYKYFLDRGVERNILDSASLEYIKNKENIYLAIVWPAARNRNDLSKHFSKLVYNKKIKLNYNGAHNLLSIAYKGEPWLGDIENGYPGVNGKLIECFPSFDEIDVYLFEEESIENVLKKKDEIRNIFKIEKHSIHITDNKDETLELANLLFNNNAINFLNHASPYKFTKTKKQIDKFKLFCFDRDIDLEDIIIDGSLVLSIYGLREANDIDFIIKDESNIDSLKLDEIDNHNNVLCFYRKSSADLIYNQNNFFIYDNVKFVSLEQLKLMKKRRGEPKDACDIHLINSIQIKKSGLYKSYVESKLRFVYSKYKLKLRLFVIPILVKFGCFDYVRNVYLKIIEKKDV